MSPIAAPIGERLSALDFITPPPRACTIKWRTAKEFYITAPSKS